MYVCVHVCMCVLCQFLCSSIIFVQQRALAQDRANNNNNKKKSKNNNIITVHIIASFNQNQYLGKKES